MIRARSAAKQFPLTQVQAVARFFIAFGLGGCVGLVTIVALGFALLSGPGGRGGIDGFVATVGLAYAVAVLVCWFLFGWRFGLGLLVGLSMGISIPLAYLSYTKGLEHQQGLKRIEDRVALASVSPPTISRPYRLLELASGFDDLKNYGDEDVWFGLLESYDVQITDGARTVLYRAGSGLDCWLDENVAMSLRLIERGMYRARPEDKCVVRASPQVGADAIVVAQHGKQPLYGVPAVSDSTIVGERMGGTFTMRARIVFVGGSSESVRPSSRFCGERYHHHLAVCMATGQRVPLNGAGHSKAEPDIVAQVASNYINHPEAQVRRIASRLLDRSQRELSKKRP